MKQRMRNLNVLLAIFISLLVSINGFAAATSTSLTYQGRIIKTDGTPLEYSNVSFIFQVTDPRGTCVIYQEQVTGYNMANSRGIFDMAIGSGTVSWPSTGSFTVVDTFNNSSSFSCGACTGASCTAGSSTYTPLVDDGRALRVQFFDGNGWKTISPDTEIRAVPFAAYSLSAQKLGTRPASDFLVKTEINNPSGTLPLSCDSGSFLTWDASTQKMGCASAGASSSQWTTAGSNIHFNTGDVGIGTSSPLSKLDVRGSARIRMGTGDRLILDDSSGNTPGSLQFMFGATYLAQNLVSSGGAFGFVNPFIGGSYIRQTSGNIQFGVAPAAATANVNNAMIIASDGKVGIGTTSPTELLHVNGVALATSWNTSSDARLKNNIVEIENPLKKILKLRGVEFDWRNDVVQPTLHDQQHDIGVIAQEVEAVFPEAVTNTPQGYKAVAYAKLVSPVIASIKTLYGMILASDKKIENLQIENEELKRKNVALEERLRKIEKHLLGN